MFTGLIEEVGCVDAMTPVGGDLSQGVRLTILARAVLGDLAIGDSIAIDGACMTVIEKTADGFCVDVSPESVSKTHFGGLVPGRGVNLERPLTPAGRLGGHFVTGHVDGLARLVSVHEDGNSRILAFELENPDLGVLLVPKGSVAILGISLTVNTVTPRGFTVAIIPHTWQQTSLAQYQVGDAVNIETPLVESQRLWEGSGLFS